MLHPQIVTWERDSRLADQLRPLAVAERWALREPRQTDSLWRSLQIGGPTVLVVKISSSASRDLSLVERVSWQLPDVAAVVVGDPEGANFMSGLAWDVGASFALFPPLSRDLLSAVVSGLMRRAIWDSVGAVSLPAESTP